MFLSVFVCLKNCTDIILDLDTETIFYKRQFCDGLAFIDHFHENFAAFVTDIIVVKINMFDVPDFLKFLLRFFDELIGDVATV